MTFVPLPATPHHMRDDHHAELGYRTPQPDEFTDRRADRKSGLPMSL
ncbi:MAG TPA: hypothetical protein PLT27_11970 [Nitrospira sp.]|nr:hypothetical protein [Nitrospira sp.]